MGILNNQYLTLVLVPILIGILQVVKKADLFDVKFIPLASLGIGLLLGIVFSGFALKDGIISGLFIGLSAVGLYSSTTNVIEGFKSK